MIDMTIYPSLFSGNVYFPFGTVLKSITCYMELRKTLEHIQISLQEQLVLLFFR